jgi:trimethylamine--corrinoid protein Co-methyltransferase
MQGFEVTPETLAVEVIEGVVGRGESFLAEDHTVRHFRREHWFPELLDRRFFDAWAEAGKDDMAARCRAKLDGILRTHEPEPPSPELCAELDRIAEAALKDAAGR